MPKLTPSKDSRTRRDAKTGVVRSFFGSELVRVAAEKKGLCAEDLCDEFLDQNRDIFRLQNINLEQTKRVDGSATQSIRYEQRHNELPVYQAHLVVGLRKRDKRVTSAVNNLDYDLPDALAPDAAKLDEATARSEVQSILANRFGSFATSEPELMVYRHQARDNEEPSRGAPPIRAEMLGIGKGRDTTVYLVWRLLVDTREPNGEWEVLVDAVDGGIVAVKDRRRYVSRPGYAFWPDPITSSQNDDLDWNSQTSTLNGERRDVTLENLDEPTDGKYRLNGKYVAIEQIESPDVAPPETTTDFEYDAKDRNFLAVMAYYYLDRFIDYARGFGIAAFNNDTAGPIRVDPQGLGGDDNSHFVVTISGEVHIAFGEGGVPDASDPGVIIHEFGHALHHFIIGSHSNSGYEEGASDFIASCWLDRFNEHLFQREKVMPWDNNKSINWGPKRRLDLSERFDDPGFNNYGNYLKGDILATALWDLFLSTGGNSPDENVRGAAADTMIHLYMEMLVNVQNNEPAEDLANGLIEADKALTGGAHNEAIKEAFRRRGMTIGQVDEEAKAVTTTRSLDTYLPPNKRMESAARKKAVPTSIPINDVSKANLESWVNHLSGYHTRHSLSPTIHQVADWLEMQFRHFGYSDVELFSYSNNGFQLNNVICTKHGTGSSGRVLIVCAHYDSIMQQPQNAVARAPGADDNASGVATMLEVARILAYENLEETLRFAAFSGEEQGLWGATAYAQHLQDNAVNVHRLINLDQVGFPPPNNAIKIERDMGNAVDTNDQASHAFADRMAHFAEQHTDLPVILDRIYASDYMPFEARGYVVAGLYEAGDNPAYHTDQDTPDKLDYDYLVGVTKITLATVMEAAGIMLDARAHSPRSVRSKAKTSGAGGRKRVAKTA